MMSVGDQSRRQAVASCGQVKFHDSLHFRSLEPVTVGVDSKNLGNSRKTVLDVLRCVSVISFVTASFVADDMNVRAGALLRLRS